MKISLGSWAFSFGPYADNPIPFDKTARRLSEAGYDGIEICGFPPHITLDRYPTKKSRREVVRLLADLNLGVSGYAADLTSVNPVVAGNRGEYLEVLRRNVEMCADIGSPAIRVDSVAAPGSIADSDYQATFARVASLWAEAAEIAQRGGIRMVWEFEPGFVFNKPSEVVAMHDRVGHPNFKVMFDTSHAYMCGVVGARQHGAKETLPGGVPEFLKKLEGRIGHIHLIDSDGTLHGDETSTHRPFGEGYIDFKGLAPQLLRVPNIEWWCIDLCFWANAWGLVEPSLKFVANLIDEKQAA
ncbi:MAG TPA: sugar phosphate isomerase/epimerase family protein [Bryobacteraceae bacterium]|nr:sugar phosphate isomerase/epimerase family protein [Bryobacteraceae bacterium]